MARNLLSGICQIWGKFRAYHQFTEVQCICNLYNCRNLFTPKHFNLNLIWNFIWPALIQCGINICFIICFSIWPDVCFIYRIEPALTTHFKYLGYIIVSSFFITIKGIGIILWYKRVLNENLPLSSVRMSSAIADSWETTKKLLSAIYLPTESW